jgi:endonuclease YncB( thermonuclease family)
MAKAIETMGYGTIGHMGLGVHGQGIGSVKQQVHDGDTIISRALGNISVRFLGIDTPEISFRLPGEESFTSLKSLKWEQFLSDPFDAAYGLPAYPMGLKSYLERKLGQDCAGNHAKLADDAQKMLEAEVDADFTAMGGDKETFAFYLRFANEVMDGYGRLLCYINRDDRSDVRPLSYNERVLEKGAAMPYFIWPNVNPFRRQLQITAAVPAPGTACQVAQSEKSLREARQWVKDNRDQHKGVFDATDPLKLEPFELRFMAQRKLPSRWVIDLSKNDTSLLPPDRYYEIPHSEDRLFIPEEYVPLFVHKGWHASGF